MKKEYITLSKNGISSRGKLIYNQKMIPKRQFRYGLRSSAAVGCGWIATYNALVLMGYPAEEKELIRYYTWQLPLINGNFGTFLFGPAIYFWKKGFGVKISFRKKRFDRMLKRDGLGILFYYWHRKWKIGAHFVTVEYKDGKVVGYNTFSNSTGPDIYGARLDTFLKERKYCFPMLVTIREKG